MGARGGSRSVIGIVNFGLRCDLGRHPESEKVRERASFADRRGDRFPKLGIAALVPSPRLRRTVEGRSITGDNPNIERFLDSVRSDN
jgi:hypothetical protein